MNNIFKSFERFIHTLSRMTISQLYYRAVRIMKYSLVYPLLGKSLYPRPELEGQDAAAGMLNDQQDSSFLLQVNQTFSEDFQAVDRLLAGEIELLNLPVSFGNSIDWDICPEGDPLWTYTLHYFEWAEPLLVAFADTENVMYLEVWLEYVDQWIDNNPPGQGPGWHPYPLSRRLLSWSKACYFLVGFLQRDLPASLLGSLNQQAGFLFHNFEYDLMNNHLISNAAALAWAGTLFRDWKDASRWQELGFAVLWKEIIRQVNSEGFHVERSHSYQEIVLQDAVAAVQLADSRKLPVPDQVRARLSAMEAALSALREPNGAFPQVHDSAAGYPPELALLPGKHTPLSGLRGSKARGGLFPAEASESSAYSESGWVIFREGAGLDADYLLFDCGSMGPPWNPGHGHAGALSFVLFSRGRPLIVDSGTYSYHQRPWRNYFRSTKAHNTLVVDGLDQSELWGSFRVGRMADCHLLKWDLSGKEQSALAEHDGYQRLTSPVIHGRQIFCHSPSQWRVIDEVKGSGFHLFEAFFHFPPGTNLEQLTDSALRVSYGGDWHLEMTCTAPKGSTLLIKEGWVSETWYQKEKAPVVCCRWEGSPPARWEYNLRIID